MFVTTGFLMSLFSCTEDVPQVLENTTFSVEPASLTLSPSSVNFKTYNSSSQTIIVSSTNVDWEFTDIPDWITISPVSGTSTSSQKVTVTCSRNEVAKDRTGVFIFKSRNDKWNYMTTVTVSQVRNVYEAIPDKDSIEFSWVESQAVVKVNANNDVWTVTAQKDLASWCTVRKNKDLVEVNCSENASVKPRSGIMTIATDDGERNVMICQSAIEVEVNVENSDTASLHFSDKAGTASIEVNTLPKVQWTASSSVDWISLSPTQGTGSGTVNVSVMDNDAGPLRTGIVRIQAYDFIQEVVVVQNGLYLNVDCPSLSFGSTGGEVLLSVKTNDGWRAQTNSEWLTISETEGDGDCNILLTVGDNNSLDSRSGSITITPKVAVPMVLNVIQAGRYLNMDIPDDTTFLFGYTGITQKRINVSTDGTYDVVVDCDEYIDVIKEKDYFILSLKEYNATEPGGGTVTVSVTGLPDGMELVRKFEIIIYGLNREAVDLGLSVKWATCNLGALQSGESGDYFAWGEILPYYKYGYALSENVIWKEGVANGYDWSSYCFSNGTETDITKYCTSLYYGSGGFVDNRTILDLEDDAAFQNWGENWRMPTQEEFEELMNSCTWTLSIQNGIKGYTVNGNKAGYTDCSIFLPLTGIRRGKTLDEKGCGYYWSASLNKDDPRSAAGLYFSIGNSPWVCGPSRAEGVAIRPVYQYSANELDSITINCRDLGLFKTYIDELTVQGYLPNGKLVKLTHVVWTSDNESVATVTNGTVNALSKGTCTISATYGSHTAQCIVTVIDPDDVIPEYVDLGLSVNWATFNLGAFKPEMYGDYYAWGATDPYYEPGNIQLDNILWKNVDMPGYSWGNYRFANGSETDITKYCTNGGYGWGGFVDNKTILDPEDDAVHVKWGGNWRMPTKEEFEELRNQCKGEWTTLNGVKGYKYTSKVTGYTDRSIFLPAAGYLDWSINDLGTYGYYNSSSLNAVTPTNIYEYQVSTYSHGIGKSGSRVHGHSVRAVCPLDESLISKLELNSKDKRLLINDQLNLSITIDKTDGITMSFNSAEWTSSDNSVATVTNGTVKAVGAGTCIITASYGPHSDNCTVTVVDPDDVTPEYVDLGLSVNWATFNIGACDPEMFGDYYAWGELEPYYEPGYAQTDNTSWKGGKSGGYNWSSYKYCNGSSQTFTKYCTNSGYGFNGFVDGKTVLEPDDDIAHVKWGGSWRMPTKEEFQELCSLCTWTKDTINGVVGYLVTSIVPGYTDRSIFLPAAGHRYSTTYYGNDNNYWTSSLNADDPSCAWRLSMNNPRSVSGNYGRHDGNSIRPVRPLDENCITSLNLSTNEKRITVYGQLYLSVTIEKTGGTSMSFKSAEWTSSDNSVATVTNGTVKAVGAGICTITASYGAHSDNCTVTVIDPDDVTPEYVDLGLSVNWATFNVGACDPEMFGDYYAWGETEPYYEPGYAQSTKPLWKSGKSSGYTWSSYKFCKGSSTTLTKYCDDSEKGYNGFADGKTVLEPEDDIAHVRWGGNWRMPTIKEFEELVNGCDLEWTNMNGVNGYKVTGKKTGYTDHSIFLPATGKFERTSCDGVEQYGCYWTSSTGIYCEGSMLFYFEEEYNYYHMWERLCGFNIRPVCNK